MLVPAPPCRCGVPLRQLTFTGVIEPSMGSFSIRFMSRDGFRESPWIGMAPGVTVLTGRNNVGKSRVLRAISNLGLVFDGGASLPVPEVRLIGDDYQVEADGTGPPAPRRWIATQAGQEVFEAIWTDSGGNLALVNSRQPSTILIAVTRPGLNAPSQIGNL